MRGLARAELARAEIAPPVHRYEVLWRGKICFLAPIRLSGAMTAAPEVLPERAMQGHVHTTLTLFNQLSEGIHVWALHRGPSRVFKH